MIEGLKSEIRKLFYAPAGSWTLDLLFEQAHSTQNWVHHQELPSLTIIINLQSCEFDRISIADNQEHAACCISCSIRKFLICWLCFKIIFYYLVTCYRHSEATWFRIMGIKKDLLEIQNCLPTNNNPTDQ